MRFGQGATRQASTKAVAHDVRLASLNHQITKRGLEKMFSRMLLTVFLAFCAPAKLIACDSVPDGLKK
jgi:hypothetical protein